MWLVLLVLYVIGCIGMLHAIEVTEKDDDPLDRIGWPSKIVLLIAWPFLILSFLIVMVHHHFTRAP